MIPILMCSACCILTTTIWFLRWWTKKKHTAIEATDGRPLGGAEQVMMNLGRKGMMTAVRAAVFSSQKPIVLQNVQGVLHRLAERHPLLRMKVQKRFSEGTTGDWFVPMEKITIKLDELPDKVWLDVMERQLSEPEINLEEGPLWLVKFLPNINLEYTDVKLSHQCALIFVFNHAICDASSMLRLINETLSYLEDELNGVETRKVIDSLPLPGTCLEVTKLSSRGPLYCRFAEALYCWFPSILGFIIKRSLFKDKSMWLKKLDSSSSTILKTSIIPMSLNQFETESLLRSCKTRSVSPFAAFQAALLTILTDRLSITGEVKFRVTVSLRPYCRQSKMNCIDQQIACYVSAIDCKVGIPEGNENSDFWNLAQSCKKTVHNNISGRVEKNMHMFSILRTNSEPLTDTRSIGTLVNFNNCGNCSFLNRDENCPVRVTSIYACSARHNGSKPLFNCHLMYFEKRFLWNLTYYSNLVNTNVASNIAALVQQKLLQETGAKSEPAEKAF